MIRKSEFVEHLLDLLASFGPVGAKMMFGGYGIYRKGRMFALVFDDILFFKTDAQTKPDFEALGLQSFTYKKKNREISLSYYQAPPEVLEDPETMQRWAEKAYAASLRAGRKGKKSPR